MPFKIPAWLHRILGRGTAPDRLRGTPRVRRLKHYSAQSGYVYEYYFEGSRSVGRGEEFLFSVSGDRKNWHELIVLVEEEAVQAWQKAHRLTLEPREHYAAAKLALFAAFDERDDPSAMRAPVIVGGEQLSGFLEQLGLGQ